MLLARAAGDVVGRCSRETRVLGLPLRSAMDPAVVASRMEPHIQRFMRWAKNPRPSRPSVHAFDVSREASANSGDGRTCVATARIANGDLVASIPVEALWWRRAFLPLTAAAAHCYRSQLPLTFRRGCSATPTTPVRLSDIPVHPGGAQRQVRPRQCDRAVHC